MTRTSAVNSPPAPSRSNRFSFSRCKQLALQLQRQGPDLVQKERAAFRQFEFAFLAGDAPGNAPRS
jgi:hypothetical protein